MNQTIEQRHIAMTDSIQDMYKKARAAFEIVEFWDQERVDEMCAAVGWELQKEDTAKELARLAVDESGIGAVRIQNKNLLILRRLCRVWLNLS